MSQRIVLSSDHVDSHGDQMTKEALESFAKLINERPALKWNIEHKRDIPPMGKITAAQIEEQDGHVYLTAEPIEFDVYEEVQGHDGLVKASCSNDSSPFNEHASVAPNKLRIELDPHIFRSYQDFEAYQALLNEKISGVELGQYGRKALINDPEVIVTLAEYWFVYKLLKPISDKTAEKISEKISDKLTEEAELLYDLIRTSIKEMIPRLIPTKKPISYVILIPGEPEIELFARVSEAEDLIKALKPRKIMRIKDDLHDLPKGLVMQKVQFTLVKGKWRFNYLLTNKGEAIGTKRVFKKRDYKLEYIEKQAQRLR